MPSFRIRLASRFPAEEAAIRKIRLGVAVALAAMSMVALLRFRPDVPRLPREPEGSVRPAAPPADLDALRAAGM